MRPKWKKEKSGHYSREVNGTTYLIKRVGNAWILEWTKHDNNYCYQDVYLTDKQKERI